MVFDSSQILLHATPYYILYKGENLIYTEKFLLKLVCYTGRKPLTRRDTLYHRKVLYKL
jgi:hypothetical protein